MPWAAGRCWPPQSSTCSYFPVGTIVAAAGIFYFVRNPAIEPKTYLKHRPIAGDGTSKWSGTIFMIAQLAWGVFVLSSIRRWTVARGMHPIHSEALFWITLAGGRLRRHPVS